jgi:hypothetical protein
MTLTSMTEDHTTRGTDNTSQATTTEQTPSTGTSAGGGVAACQSRRLPHDRHIAFAGAATAVVLVLSSVFATSAQAGPSSPPRDGQHAAFAGKTINMKNGWNGAQTCVVHSRTLVQCYATAGAADRALGYSAASDPPVRQAAADSAARAVPSCASGYVCLWAAINGGGRRLIFRDDYWQDLRPYGFHNEISSWRNHQTLADYAWLKDVHGGGPDPDEHLLTAGGEYVANVGSYWNDRADYVEG